MWNLLVCYAVVTLLLQVTGRTSPTHMPHTRTWPWGLVFWLAWIWKTSIGGCGSALEWTSSTLSSWMSSSSSAWPTCQVSHPIIQWHFGDTIVHKYVTSAWLVYRFIYYYYHYYHYVYIFMSIGYQSCPWVYKQHQREQYGVMVNTIYIYGIRSKIHVCTFVFSCRMWLVQGFVIPGSSSFSLFTCLNMCIAIHGHYSHVHARAESCTHLKLCSICSWSLLLWHVPLYIDWLAVPWSEALTNEMWCCPLLVVLWSQHATHTHLCCTTTFVCQRVSQGCPAG